MVHVKIVSGQNVQIHGSQSKIKIKKHIPEKFTNFAFFFLLVLQMFMTKQNFSDFCNSRIFGIYTHM